MLEEGDRQQLAAQGISVAEIERQLRIFADPPPAPDLARAATVGDGIVVLDRSAQGAALAACARALAADRVLKFVPASGAATRMFQDLLAARRAGGCRRRDLEGRAGTDAAARETLRFADALERLPFRDALADAARRRGADLAALQRDGDVGAIVDALLEPDGLGYATAPKGLVLFHRYADGSRTAFEEHLGEGAALAAGSVQTARLHFTVSPEHEAGFRALLECAALPLRQRTGIGFSVGFSHQEAATDTVAVDPQNRPFRTADGRLLLRPGGHGALIANLDGLRDDIIYVKNIDNIPAEHLREPVTDCARLLIGHLVRVQDELFAHRAALELGGVDHGRIEAARRFAAETLQRDVAAGDVRAALCALFDRPLRVCGMVRNTGEPGGGPFWVREADGATTLQIVESAQVDPRRAEQRAVFAGATHFNPVVMALGVRDWRGRPFDLQAFVDPTAVFIAEKSREGRPLKALERPGLWNGAMARWNTIFVEVSDVTFSPVKTVNDLLRPAHQPPADATRAAAGDR